jgi:hypothetical protein
LDGAMGDKTIDIVGKIQKVFGQKMTDEMDRELLDIWLKSGRKEIDVFEVASIFPSIIRGEIDDEIIRKIKENVNG